MSASQDKKKRQAEREAGTDKYSVAEREETEKKRKQRIKWTVIIAIMVVFAAVIVILNTNLFYTGTTAVTVGDYTFTNAEYEYYYHSAYYSFCNTYSSYLSLFLDTSKPLNEQQYSDDMTWEDYFRESALSNMAQVTALYDAATKAGYTLSEDDAASIDTEIANLGTYAAYYSYSSTANYISDVYGRGCTEATVRKLMERSYIASAYASDTYDSFTYTTEELEADYAAKADDYDTFTYNYYLVNADKIDTTEAVTDEETGETTDQTTSAVTDETMAAAKSTADAISAAYTDALAEDETADYASTFAAALADGADGAEPTTRSAYTGSYVTSYDAALSDWLKDSSRAAGDVTVVESADTGYYVVVFLDRGDNTYNTVSARHILINATDSDSDGTYSDEELAAAEKSINDIYDEWKSGDMTEDSFAALANEYSEDTGSNTTGGLYENIYKGRMVTEFNDFIFDSSREPGDTGIVFNSSSSYTGYHLIYFVGEGVRYCDYLADTDLREADYTEWSDGITADWSASVHGFVAWFADI